MTRKDYIRAAQIAGRLKDDQARCCTEAFVELFRGDNPRFDEDRFREACVPGLNATPNVKKRPA